jgi:predicted ArsR family transcriptional regulator
MPVSKNFNDFIIMDAKNTVLEVLKNEGAPMSAGQIAEKCGLDRKEIDKAMKSLKEEELIVSPRRCYWEPKK